MPQGRHTPVQSGSPAEDTFAFDAANSVRIWLGEAVKRGQVTEQQALEVIRNIDGEKAIATTEDQVKLWIGPIKDSFGSVKLATKIGADFEKWWKCRVYFKPGSNGDLVIIKGWPNGRQLLKGTRYRVDSVKIMELQIGKPGIQAAAKESARFGLILVVAVDMFQFARDRNFADLLGSLTVDIPSVLLASAIGAAAGSLVAGVAVIGTFALGPALFAFGVGVLAGIALYKLDKYFGLTEKVQEAYAHGLEKLTDMWNEAGDEAHKRWQHFVNSNTMRDLRKDWHSFEDGIGNAMKRSEIPLSVTPWLL